MRRLSALTLVAACTLFSGWFWQGGTLVQMFDSIDHHIATQFPDNPNAWHLASLRRVYQQPPSTWPAPQRDPDAVAADLAPWQRDSPQAAAAVVSTFSTTPTIAQVELGQRLFNDPILSASGQISCQSCHHPELGWGDGLSRSVGHNRTQGKRNAPPLFNAVHQRSLGWDGSASSLAAQLRNAMTHPAEMGVQTPDDIVRRLEQHADYRQRFTQIYGPAPIASSQLDDALIAFLGTLERPTTLDHFLAGDSTRLSDQQVWGMHLFRTKARCINCHAGPLLSDQGFHNLGLSFFLQASEDLGRYQATDNPEDAGRFRTPSLRHLAQTAPYMHNGVFRDLRGVVNFYTQGGGETRVRNDQEAAHPLYVYAARKSALLKPVALSAEEIDALTAFLQAL
ncbi:cytochrome-c peroxidase [Pigmentiphaga aceris]|uniref:Cytochrome-c peroxidase n=1 Tax=Pigmentiphaga aceris TaxID=1940612 RepID=A0A5C0ATJ8_9BURK|nr:cytochrome c peroxidase [Pigmentiphaga aceris]QEI04633.1 cytochrome-c peroxidase [Pigmentiphaga aceris]